MTTWTCKCGSTLDTEPDPTKVLAELLRNGWRLSRHNWWVCKQCARTETLDDPAEEAMRKRKPQTSLQ